MAIEVSYLGMLLEVPDQDPDNLAYFRYCAAGDFHLQRCAACNLLRYPPGPSCPWCAALGGTWVPVAGVGTVHTFTKVHHAIQPGFKPSSPYALLIVDLDAQRGLPTPHEALRVVGNLVRPDGSLEGPAQVAAVGIGSRVRMAFTPLGPDIALPNWTLDAQPAGLEPWRLEAGVAAGERQAPPPRA